MFDSDKLVLLLHLLSFILKIHARKEVSVSDFLSHCDVPCSRQGAAMSASDSDDDSYNERSALVPSENPVVPSYVPDSDLAAAPTAANASPSKRVMSSGLQSVFCSSDGPFLYDN